MIQNSNATVVQLIANALKKDILPELKTEASAQAGSMIFSLLGLLVEREQQVTPVYEALLLQQKKVLEGMKAILSKHNISLDADFNLLDMDGYNTSQQEQLMLNQHLADHAKALTSLRSSLPVDEQREVDNLLQDMAKNDLELTNEFLMSVDTTLSSIGTEETVEINAERIKNYLDNRFPEKNYQTVSNVGGAGFSMSKQIYFFDVQDAQGKNNALVLRQQKPVQSIELDCTLVTNEFKVMKNAYELGLPVPEPLWLETNGELGPDFMVMRKVNGSQIGEPFQAFKPLSEGLIMEIAEFLARLHGAGLEPFREFLELTDQKAILNMTTAEATLFRLEQWETYYNEKAHLPNPGKIWLFDWLKRNVPDNTAPPVLVHGDFNIHNLLAEDDSITACLDWEWAHPGNPLEDLNNMKKHVDKYSNWQRFYQHYIAHGGPKVELDQQVLDYNTCLTNTIYAVASRRLAWMVQNKDVSDLASVFGANNYGFQFHKLALSGSLNANK